MKKRNIITISRQYGSGGRLIGKTLAKRLGVAFYDNELITMAAEKSGYGTDLFEKADSKATNKLLFTLSMGTMVMGNGGIGTFDAPLNDQVFMIQSSVIEEVASTHSCVIIGRCADYVLREDPDRTNIFIHAALPIRVERAISQYGVKSDEAEAFVRKTDKRRATYYNYYSGLKWGDSDNYHLSVDSGVLGLERTCDVVEQFIRARED